MNKEKQKLFIFFFGANARDENTCDDNFNQKKKALFFESFNLINFIF